MKTTVYEEIANNLFITTVDGNIFQELKTIKIEPLGSMTRKSWFEPLETIFRLLLNMIDCNCYI